VGTTDGTKDLSDLSGLSEPELLSMPEDNLPASQLPELLQRREDALQKKRALDASGDETRLNSQNRTKEQTETEDEQRYQMEAEAYQAAMRDIYDREDILLKEVDDQEQREQQQLADIDRRALRLSDGRLAYVGTNGAYVDQQGHVLQGKDAADAQAQNRLHPDAATWAERSSAKQQYDATIKLKQEILDAKNRQVEEDGKDLTPEQRQASVSENSATISRYETEFQEQLAMTSANASGAVATDSTFGGDDYMAAYGGSGSALGPAFAAAANGTNANAAGTKLQAQPQTAPAPAPMR